MHKLEDKILITPLLLRRFQDEAAYETGRSAQDYFAYIQTCDGHIRRLCPYTIEPAPHYNMFACDLLGALNKHLHHDGAWVFVYTDPTPFSKSPIATFTEYERFCFIFLDRDGDPQFTVDWIANNQADQRDFTACMTAGPDSWIEKCESAWQIWKTSLEPLDLRSGETIKKAQGQSYTPTAPTSKAVH